MYYDFPYYYKPIFPFKGIPTKIIIIMAKKKPKFCVDHIMRANPTVSLSILVHKGFKNTATAIAAAIIIIKTFKKYLHDIFEYCIGLVKF